MTGTVDVLGHDLLAKGVSCPEMGMRQCLHVSLLENMQPTLNGKSPYLNYLPIPSWHRNCHAQLTGFGICSNSVASLLRN